MDRTSNSVEYGILINQQNYDGYAIIAEIRQKVRGAIPKCGHVALVLDCCYVDICVIFSSSGSLRMRSISQFSRASGARFSETDDSPETVVGRWILPAKLKALLGSSTHLPQVVPVKDIMAESKSPLFGIAPPLDCARVLPPIPRRPEECD